MAKRSGLNFKDEKEFAKEFTPSKLHPTALKQIVDQLRVNNTVTEVKPALDASKVTEPIAPAKQETELKQQSKEADKRTEKLIESNKRLTSNVEKLSTTMRGITGNSFKPGANRAEQIAGKQQFDYRSIGQRAKEGIMGRGGDKWDTNSMRYKLGSVRGLMGTLGVRGIPLADNAAGIREERLRTATRMTEANAGMQNLKGFAVRDPITKKIDQKASKKNVEKYYQEKGKAAIPAKAKLQSEAYNRDKYRQAGISDEEFDRTSGGKQQNRKLAMAGQGVIDTDPRMQGEKKGAVTYDEGKGEESTADKLNVSEEESSQLKALGDMAKPDQELLAITKAENARKEKADNALLAAVQNIKAAEGGGALGDMADIASNMTGKGKGKAGKLGKLAKFAGKGAKFAKIGGGVLAGGLAVAEGFSDYKDASAAEARGEITKDQADVKKTGAVSGAAGGLGGTLAGGAIGQALIPIPGVGFAIGAGVGAFAGSKLGKGIGEWGAKKWKGMTGNKAQETLKQNQAIQAPLSKANEVMERSANNESAKFTGTLQPSNTIVNAPTTISKQTKNTAVVVPIRDQDHSLRAYYRSRFAT